MLLSRASAVVAERIRNLFPGGASPDLLQRTENSIARRGPFSASDRITLTGSKHSLEISRLALGTGTNGWSGSSNQTRKLGVSGLAGMLQHGLEEQGLDCWDVADMYGSHPHIAEALKSVERDRVVILTKTVAETADAMRADLDRFRRELKTDVIDILLLHCMTSRNWRSEMRPVMDVISEAQEQGIVRMKGVSCHSFAALEAAVAEPWVELDLARINPGGQSMDAGPDQVVPVFDRMKDAGKVVMGMKIVGGGRLVEEREACLRFALGLDCVDCFTMGFESRDQLDEAVRLIAAV